MTLDDRPVAFVPGDEPVSLDKSMVQQSLFGRPPGTGWAPIPNGKRGGFRRRARGGWEYWYPGDQAPKHVSILPVIQNDPALTPGQKRKAPSPALRKAQGRDPADPTEWQLPAGARIDDPWEMPEVDPTAKWAHPDLGSGTGRAPWEEDGWVPDMSKYDYLVVNSSAGKDSQAMLSHVVELVDKQKIPRDKVIVVHADLGRAEWEGTLSLARQQAEAYGLRFEVVQRRQNDLIDQIDARHGDLSQRSTDVGKLAEAGIRTWSDLMNASEDQILAVIGEGTGTSQWSGPERAKKLRGAAKRKVAVLERARAKKMAAAKARARKFAAKSREASTPAQKDKSKRKALDAGAEYMRLRAEEFAGAPVDFGKAVAWPSSDARYCTSDHKRAEIQKLHTALGAEFKASVGRKPRVLNMLGIRAQESVSRTNMDAFSRERDTSGVTVDRWYPIHRWPEKRVWDTIRDSGLPHHKAYDLGMQRLSCVFCVFATPEDLMIAAKHNRKLFNTYLELEEKVGTSFQPTRSLADVREVIQQRREEGLRLNDFGEWVKKAVSAGGMDLVKAMPVGAPPVQLILVAANERLLRSGVKVSRVALDWKVTGLCVHLEDDRDSHHAAFVLYPEAYNSSMVAATFAQRLGYTFEEHNAPPPIV